MKQQLMDIVLVIACALGLSLVTTGIRAPQETPVLAQIVQLVRQRGLMILNVDHATFDKATESHAAERPE